MQCVKCLNAAKGAKRAAVLALLERFASSPDGMLPVATAIDDAGTIPALQLRFATHVAGHSGGFLNLTLTPRGWAEWAVQQALVNSAWTRVP